MTALRDDGTRFVPHVVEPSFGLDRLFIAALETSYTIRDKRNVLGLPRDLAPYQVSVLPLVTKDSLPEKAREVHERLLDAGFIAAYDESGSIGRRYARSDEIGTPLAVTVDYDTLKEGTVTLRDRNSWDQVRLPIKELACRLRGYFDHELDFPGLGEKI
jgi:glycyl-tRNA synthetase